MKHNGHKGKAYAMCGLEEKGTAYALCEIKESISGQITAKTKNDPQSNVLLMYLKCAAVFW